MRIYTKTGDSGETSLYGGSRVAKDDPRVWCYGTVDEANSILGVLRASLKFDDLKSMVRKIQGDMFLIGAQLAADETGRGKLENTIQKGDIAYLEGIIDRYTEEFGGTNSFIVPGETACSSLFHVARTVVRRAERHVVALDAETSAEKGAVCPILLKYLNRLSDALYVMAKLEVYRSFIRKVSERVLETASSVAGKDGSIPPCAALCERLFSAALGEAEKIGVPISFALVDKSGVLIYFRRCPGALLISVEMAQNKAYTAAAMEVATGELAEAVGPAGHLYGLNTTDPKLVVFGGGLPLFAGGKLVGGLGVSGGSIEQDEQIAKTALDIFSKLV